MQIRTAAQSETIDGPPSWLAGRVCIEQVQTPATANSGVASAAATTSNSLNQEVL